MAVSDYRAGKLVATVPIGAGTDGAGFDPSTGDAFASSADGTLTIIHEDSPNAYHVAQTVATMAGSRTLGVDPITHAVFLAGATFDTPPAAGVGAPRPRPRVVSGSFVVLVVERQ